jgi:hypothetical protein
MAKTMIIFKRMGWTKKENKKLQRCTAPEDKIGKGRCDHVSSQFVSETVDEFIKRL